MARVIQPTPHLGECYNRTSFQFAHALCGCSLFSLTQLMELARRRAATSEFAYWSSGQINVTDRWEAGTRTALSLQDTLAAIAQSNSLVMLRRIETDPVFRPLMEEIFEEILTANAGMRDDVIIARGTILIASPRRVTSYHIDADLNFLLQIAGEKRISVFDQTNRAVLSDQELERYFSGDHNGPRFSADKQAHATTYDLRAGNGVHIPCMAPHWARNSDEVSIALSVNFDLRSVERLGRVYRVNGKLRQLGHQPLPPGRSRWRDIVKVASLRAWRGLLDLHAAGKHPT